MTLNDPYLSSYAGQGDDRREEENLLGPSSPGMTAQPLMTATQPQPPAATTGATDSTFSGQSYTETISSAYAPAGGTDAAALDEFAPLTSSTVYNHDVVGSSSAAHPNQADMEKIEKMKRRRKRRTVVAGVTAGAVGLVVAGPLLGVALGAGCAVATKKIGKRNEKRKLEKYQQSGPSSGVVA